MNSLRLVMMGTGPFAVPTFQALLASPHQVLGLVTRPDRPVHRHSKPAINPMREVARQQNLEVFEPASINSAEAQTWLRDRNADLFVVCDYGQILSRESLSLAQLGGINLHASLLPKYRGAAPINWAIYHGETETGVTVIHMTPQLDAGPALVQARVTIEPTETATKLEARLSELGARTVLDSVAKLASGDTAQGIAQDQMLATKAPRLKKEDGLVHWSRSATEIFNQVRAFEPWPKTYTFWKRETGEPIRLILEQVKPLAAQEGETNGAGTVIELQGEYITVACGTGCLQIHSLQPAGKRVMSAGEFLRGHSLQVGQRFG